MSNVIYFSLYTSYHISTMPYLLLLPKTFRIWIIFPKPAITYKGRGFYLPSSNTQLSKTKSANLKFSFVLKQVLVLFHRCLSLLTLPSQTQIWDTYVALAKKHLHPHSNLRLRLPNAFSGHRFAFLRRSPNRSMIHVSVKCLLWSTIGI